MPYSQISLHQHLRSAAQPVALLRAGAVLALFVCFFQNALGQADPTSRSWNKPVTPFRIVGNIYYVGAFEVSSFLITTEKGHILLDSGFAETVPQIKDNVAALGFKLSDIKVLLNSHAHFDHAGGLAEMKKLTGAKFLASAEDADLLERGGKNDFHFGDRLTFPPVQVDQRLHDGDTAELGGVTMTAHLTPGHTKGCTTWTTSVSQDGKSYSVVFVGSASVPGYRLIGNDNYPNIVADYEKTFRVLKSLPCDVFLGSHGSFFSLQEKVKRLRDGAKDAFFDPDGYQRYIRESEDAFRKELERQKAEGH